ncbi:GNAT family N-acetyltransferase [Hydrogenophaga sp.]|uniref:GNAT family N-acetyltransferase n=1 Tax=Hydrogenophaga sp. TaxID=1904254 RepID=UPI002FC9F72D
MSFASYEIRRMTRGHLSTTIGWAAREGWNPGLHDLDPFHVIDPDGFFMGWLGERPVASIACVRYGDSHGFIGLYMVEPTLRRHGLGLALWNAALGHVKGCVVGLDGVPAQQDNYRRSGFELAWYNVRYRGWGRESVAQDRRVVSLSSLPFARLVAYDQAFQPVARPVFLQAWIQMPQSHALGWWEDGELRGYGVLRACKEGHKLAPLCADSPAIAEALFEALCARARRDQPVFMDVPECNLQATRLALTQGMEATFPTARMYRGPAPQLALSRLYGLTTLEVG